MQEISCGYELENLIDLVFHQKTVHIVRKKRALSGKERWPHGTVLMTLVPRDEPLLAEVWIESIDAGFVKAGQGCG